MYLSNIALNPRDRRVQRDLADCHALHRTLMSGWPDLPTVQGARRALSVLYRVEPVRIATAPVLLVQSMERPDWSRLPAGYLAARHHGAGADVKPINKIYARITVGSRFRFRLRANPTRYIRPPGRPEGQRVDLRREADKVAWLVRKGEQCGFELVPGSGGWQLLVHPTERLTGRRNGRSADRVTIAATLFEGVLTVTDPAKFANALKDGIGRGKAYGCGLLSLAPLERGADA